MTVKIQVLGTGCAKCAELAKNAEAAAKSLGVDYELEKVTDVQRIMQFGVMTTPGLVVDGKVVASGKALSAEEVAALLKASGAPAAAAPSCCSSGCCCGPAPEQKKAPAGSGCGCECDSTSKGGTQPCTCASGGGTGGGCCCSGGGLKSSLRLWLFPLLALAVAGVLWLKAKNEQKPAPARPAASSLKVPATGEIRAAPAPAAVPAQAEKPKALPKLVDLGAVGCKPCKIMDGVLEELRKGYAGRLEVEFINVRTEEAKAEPYNVNLIPTQVWLDASGKELFRHEGVMSADDIVKKFKELGIDLGAAAAAP